MAETGETQPTVTFPIVRGPIVPISAELLRTIQIDYDAPTQRPSPLVEAERELADAQEELEYAAREVERLTAELERVRATPGSDIKPPPGPSLLESLHYMMRPAKADD